MICSNCGKELKDDDLFCSKCGTKQIKERKCLNCGNILEEDAVFCAKCGTKQEEKSIMKEQKQQESVFLLSHRFVLSAVRKFYDLENTSYSAFNSDLSSIKRSLLDYFGNMYGTIKKEYRNCSFFNNYINYKNFVCLISEKYDYGFQSNEIEDTGLIIFTTDGFQYQKNIQAPQSYIKFAEIIDCKIMEFKNKKNAVIHYLSNNEKKSLFISEDIYTPENFVELIEELSSDDKSVDEESIPLEMISIPDTKTSVLSVPVVQRLYEIVMRNNPSKFKNVNDSFIRPVENVSQIDAFIFCNRLSVLNGKTPCYSYKNDNDPDHWPDSIIDDDFFKCDFCASGYRLLTPYEWQIAAKGNQTYQHAGGAKIKDVGWSNSNSLGETHSVKQKWANGYRLYDMNGNVWEWVDSWNVVYGGSWKDGNDSYKFNTYKVISPNEKYDDVGFRIASGPELIYENYGYGIEGGSWETTRI